MPRRSKTFLADNGIDRATIDVVGFHGQTVLHRPEDRLTVQIGDGAALARAARHAGGLRFPRRRRRGGRAGRAARAGLSIARSRATLDRPHPIAVLNLGGVANVTFIDGDGDPIAFDTGPGNALIDDFMRARTGAPLRRRRRARPRAGRVDEAAVARLLDASVLRAAAPKSLDRNDFRAWVAAHAGLSRAPRTAPRR